MSVRAREGVPFERSTRLGITIDAHNHQSFHVIGESQKFRGNILGSTGLLCETLKIPPSVVMPFGLIHDIEQKVRVELDAVMLEELIFDYHPRITIQPVVFRENTWLNS